MSTTIKYFIDAECDACGHLFRVEVTSRTVSTGGRLDVLRLTPYGQMHLKFLELSPPPVCPDCEEPIE